MIWLMREAGNRNARARACGLRPRASSSSFSTSPGCGAGPNSGLVRAIGMAAPPSVIIHDLDVPGMAAAEFEGDPPRTCYRDRPLPASIALQPVKPDRSQPG